MQPGFRPFLLEAGSATRHCTALPEWPKYVPHSQSCELSGSETRSSASARPPWRSVVSNRRAWSRTAASIAALILFGLASIDASANNREACYRDFEPHSGQPGKDVVWVPTNDELVEGMLRMAQVKPTDLVYDLGAGDGKIAIAAARDFGARSVGIEYNP